MEQDKIIQQLRSGKNGDALRELYRSFPAVSHFIRTNGGSEDDARDLFQESLLVFYRNAQKPDFTLTSSAGTYLYSIVKYMWKDELKKKNRMVPFGEEAAEAAEDVQSYRIEEQRFGVLNKVLDQLGEKCSGILQLFYYKKLAMEEIAQRLNYKNVDTAKTQKYKCMERAKIMANELMFSTLTEEL